MATASNNLPASSSSEISISQLVDKISKREELQSKYPYLQKFESVPGAAQPKTNLHVHVPNTTPVVLSDEIDGNEPTHGSVKSRFTILPPIRQEDQENAETGGSDGYESTDTNVSLSGFINISRCNSRACDCTSPCVHQVLEDAPDSATGTENNGAEGKPAPDTGRTEADASGVALQIEEESAGCNSGATSTASRAVNPTSRSVNTRIEGASAVSGPDSSTNDMNAVKQGETRFYLRTPSHEEKRENVVVSMPSDPVDTKIDKNTVQQEADMVGLLPSVAKEEEPKEDASVEGNASKAEDQKAEGKVDNTSLPPIENGVSSGATNDENKEQPTGIENASVVMVKEAETPSTRSNVKSSGSDLPKSDRAGSVNSTGSSSMFDRRSRSSSSGDSQYVPSSPKKRLRRKTTSSPQYSSQLPKVGLKATGSPKLQGRFPQVQSPNLRPGSELSNVPYRHRLSAVSQSDTSIKSSTSVTPSKVIVMDEPSVRDNIGQQHLQALQNQLNFTSANTAIQGKPLGVPDCVGPRPMTVNGVVSQDRGLEFKGEDDNSFIDAVSRANGTTTPVKNNALPGKFRYAKVSQPKKGNFALSKILNKVKKKKKNATEDNPEADRPMKAKDDAWLSLSGEDVSFPAAYLASTRHSSASEEDVRNFDTKSLDIPPVPAIGTKGESKKSLLAKFKRMLKPKSKVKKFTPEMDSSGGQGSITVHKGSDFMGALLPEPTEGNPAGSGGDLGGIKPQGSVNKQQQRPHFVRHMKQMQEKARESSRKSFMNGQMLPENSGQSVLSYGSSMSNEELLAKIQQEQGQSSLHGGPESLTSAHAPPGDPAHPQQKMYYVNVSGEKIFVEDPDQVPLHDQIVVDPHSGMMLQRDPANPKVWVPPNTPHLDATDFYYRDESELYQIQSNDKVLLAALNHGGAPPNTPHTDTLSRHASGKNSPESDPDFLDLQYDTVEYILEGDLPPEFLAMTPAEQHWIIQDSLVGGRRSCLSNMATQLQTIREEDEKSRCPSSVFGDDEDSDAGGERSEPDGQSTGSLSRGGSNIPPATNDTSQPTATDSKSAADSNNGTASEKVESDDTDSAKGDLGKETSNLSKRITSAKQILNTAGEGRVSSAARGATLLTLVHGREAASARQRSRSSSSSNSLTRNESPLARSVVGEESGETKAEVTTSQETSAVEGNGVDISAPQSVPPPPPKTPAPAPAPPVPATSVEAIRPEADGSADTPNIPPQNTCTTDNTDAPAPAVNIAAARPPSNMSNRQEQGESTELLSKTALSSASARSDTESINSTTTRPPSARRPLSSSSERRYTSLDPSVASGPGDASAAKTAEATADTKPPGV